MMRWALGGVAAGALAALLAFAPAAWLADALASATGERLLLADARGTVWSGSAAIVLTGGAGSHDASVLPGRLHWSLSPDGPGLTLRARHACCINGELRLLLRPGLGRMRLELPPVQGAIGQWPAAWLAGLGTPWNTLRPTGALQVSSPGLKAEWVQGHWLFSGRADVELNAMASRVSSLDVLGSYRVRLQGDDANGAASMQLSTTSGPLQLSGSGQWSASKLRFGGQASAEPGSESALNNLLNIIGRRQGALSVLSIG